MFKKFLITLAILAASIAVFAAVALPSEPDLSSEAKQLQLTYDEAQMCAMTYAANKEPPAVLIESWRIVRNADDQDTVTFREVLAYRQYHEMWIMPSPNAFTGPNTRKAKTKWAETEIGIASMSYQRWDLNRQIGDL